MNRDITKYQFFKALTELPYIEKIYLYGSRGRGSNMERSDIDIALYCPKAEIKDWDKILKIINNADTLLGIDCLRLDAVKSEAFKSEILKDGILLFERK